MPIPATTGTQRTNIWDMKIGDYIKMGSFGGSAWQFNGGTTELPTTGIPYAQNFGDYYFYMIKVAKGILVADRVVQHTVSWDTLNSAKLIEGKTSFIGPRVNPLITADEPIRIRHNYTSITQPLWRAFDGNTATHFDVNYKADGWIIYDMLAPIEFNYFEMDAFDTGIYAILYFELYGSNDDVTYNPIGVYRNTDTSISKATLSFPSVRYRHIKIVGHKCNHGAYTWAREIRLMNGGPLGILRSLTGGVAYADANGNRSFTDQGYGGWPTNNEWNKYIINFPADKISSGKTLEDVFHHKTSFINWCQGTPISGMPKPSGGIPNPSSNIGRIYRYGTSLDWAESSWGTVYNGTSQGFRPVFEYKDV